MTQIDEIGARVQQGLERCVADDQLLGLVWSVTTGEERRSGAIGYLDAERRRPVDDSSIFRISSMTKPVTAVAALLLVEDGAIDLADPVDAWLPELADRRVLVRRDAAPDDTVAAPRAVTLEDLLSFRFGLGFDFTDWSPTPIAEALGGLELGSGPPAPALPPPPDEWIRRLGTLPLQYPPGERWLYDLSADVLGVLIARVAACPFEQFLVERLFAPLGMVDTGFAVPPSSLDRFGACFTLDEDGERSVYDPVDGQWSAPPAFPGGAAGLVSTLADFGRFADLLRHDGSSGDRRLLAADTVRLMTTDRLTEAQRAAGPSPDGRGGWGLGLGVQVVDDGTVPAGAYGWDGGLGSVWRNDPARDTSVVLLTNQMWTSPEPPPVCDVILGALRPD